MHDVFISYSTKDMAQAVTVRDVLEKNEIPCWMAPRDIPGGSNYAREIPVAIRSCQVFVLILSENAQKSNWVIKELDSAVNCGKVILPFMLEDCPLSDEFNFLLTGAQRYAAYQKKAEVLNTLVGRIKAITAPVSKQPGAEPSPEPPAKAEPVPQAPVKASAPVVVPGKPKKPAKVKSTAPHPKFTFGRKELTALLAVPAMALLGAAGVLLGNLLYFAGRFGGLHMMQTDWNNLLFFVVFGALLGLIMAAEWIFFRFRQSALIRTAPVCPNCGDNEVRVHTFRSVPVTKQEKLLALLIPTGALAAFLLSFPGCVLLLKLTPLYYLNAFDFVEIRLTCALLGLAIGAYLANLLLRLRRQKSGFWSSTCFCRDCHVLFVPVLSGENIEN